MRFAFTLMELDIAPLREDVSSYVIRMASTKRKRTGSTTVLCEVSRKSLLKSLASVLGGERFRTVDVFPMDDAFERQVRLEQETFTDGKRGPDGLPRNLIGVALNFYHGQRADERLSKVAGEVMAMEEAFCLLDALQDDQGRKQPTALSLFGGPDRVVMANSRSSLAPIRGSDPSAPIPPFPTT